MFHHKNHRRRGVVAVLAMVSVVAIVGFAALVLDLAAIYNTRADLQRAADASVLAAVQVYTNVTDKDVAASAAIYTAQQFAVENRVYGMRGPFALEDGDIEFGQFDIATDTFTPGADPPDAVRIIARRTEGHSNGPLNMTFARLFGVASSSVKAEAISMLTPVTTTDGVPAALRAPGFGPIDPDIVEANPGKDGPSEPLDGVSFEIGEQVTVFVFGKGAKSPVHLILNTNDIPGEEFLGKVMKGEKPPVPLGIGDTLDVVGDGTGHNGLGQKLARRLNDGDPSNDMIIAPVVAVIESFGDCGEDPCTPTFDDEGKVEGDVKVVDFVAIHLDAILEVEVPDPHREGMFIDIEILVGTIVQRAVSGYSSGDASGFVDGVSVGIVQLVR